MWSRFCISWWFSSTSDLDVRQVAISIWKTIKLLECSLFNFHSTCAHQRLLCVSFSVRSEKKSLFIAHFIWSDGRSWKDKFQQQKSRKTFLRGASNVRVKSFVTWNIHLWLSFSINVNFGASSPFFSRLDSQQNKKFVEETFWHLTPSFYTHLQTSSVFALFSNEWASLVRDRIVTGSEIWHSHLGKSCVEKD